MGGGRDDTRVVLGDDLQGVDEAVAEIVGEGDVVGGDHSAVGILDADVALGLERVRPAVVDHAIGKQRVVAVVDLDVALGGDPVVVVVVDHLVGLQQHRLGRIDLWGLDELLETRLRLAERRLPRGKAGGESGKNARKQDPAQARERHALRRSKAGLSPAHPDHVCARGRHHPSSLYKSTVSASEAAMITGTQAAATAEVSPAMAKLREISEQTKKVNPAASPNTALI